MCFSPFSFRENLIIKHKLDIIYMFYGGIHYEGI